MATYVNSCVGRNFVCGSSSSSNSGSSADLGCRPVRPGRLVGRWQLARSEGKSVASVGVGGRVFSL